MPAASGRITVRERIDPEITATLFANYRSSADALMELVDNAVDSRLPGRPLEVELSIHPAWILVTTRGGEGMGPRDLERRYLRWGKSPKRGKNLLGQYGQGGKAAIGHLGARFSVEASRPGDEQAWRFADPDYRERSRLKRYELQTVDKRVDGEVGYVRVRIDGVDKRVDAKRLTHRLADAYRPLLTSGHLKMVVNGATLQAAPLGESDRMEFRVRAGQATLKGWVGTIATDHRAVDFVPGLRCYKLGRLVTQGEFFGHATPAQSPGMGRLIGEVEIPQAPLTINKTDFSRDSPLWVAVEQRLHRLLAPLAKRLAKEDQPPPPASALKVAEQVRRLLSQVLRIADRVELFPGSAPTHRRGEASMKTPSEPLELREPSPRSAAKPGAGEPSRRGFGDIVIRPLDAAVRSQTANDHGVKQVVINSRYPLFVERHGDVWYQLETAAREVCKSMEAVSVVEYERRVNEIVMLAFELRTRRRMRRRAAAQLKLIP